MVPEGSLKKLEPMKLETGNEATDSYSTPAALERRTGVLSLLLICFICLQSLWPVPIMMCQRPRP